MVTYQQGKIAMSKKFRNALVLVSLACGVSLPVLSHSWGQVSGDALYYKHSGTSEAESPKDSMEGLLAEYQLAKQDNNTDLQSKIKDKIKDLTRKQFQAMESTRQSEVEAMEKRLDNLKALLKVRAERSEEIIDLRVQQLIGERSVLDWEADPKEEKSSDKRSLLRWTKPSGDAESVRKKLLDLQGNYGNIGIGMAGIYQKRMDAEREFKKAQDLLSHQKAELDVLWKSADELKKVGKVDAAKIQAERASDLAARLEQLKANSERLAAAREEVAKQVQSGEATLREYEKLMTDMRAALDLLKKTAKESEEARP
jgi:hypothetical protein